MEAHVSFRKPPPTGQDDVLPPNGFGEGVLLHHSKEVDKEVEDLQV